MKLAFRTASCGKKSSRILQELLHNRDIDTGPAADTHESEGVVCYGWGSYDGEKPALNAKAGVVRGLEQLKVLSQAGICVPAFTTDWEHADFNHFDFPMLARNTEHIGGEGIKPVFQPEEIPWRKAAGAEYFVSYVPSRTEYRVYVYRQRLLGAYKKVMARPEQYRGIGRNFKDGFDFQFIQRGDVIRTVGRSVLQLASDAVHHLGLDFGGVDILHGKDGNFYVLEVNSAPGAFGPANVWINNLADRITTWTKNDFPARSKTRREIEIA